MKRNRIVSIGSRLALATTLAAVASLILACGSSYPSESAARKVLENLGRDDRVLIKWTVKTFTKTNSKGDDKEYIVEYDAELECGSSDSGNVLGDLHRYGMGCHRQSGRMIKESGMIPFEKTEKGWRGPDGNIY